MKTQILSVLVGLSSSSAAFAGPSVSVGPQQAPWVYSQEVMRLVIDFASKNSLPINAIAIDKKDSSIVRASVDCWDYKKATYVFRVSSECAKGIATGVCIPERSLEIDTDLSQECKH